MLTTNTWQKLAQPEKTAGEIAKETEWVKVTEGSEAQIKFANSLRLEFVKNITQNASIRDIRWAVIEQTQNGLDLTDAKNKFRLEYSVLAQDAVNRRAIRIINTSDAKAIINYFKDTKTQVAKNDLINTYDKVIRHPNNFQYDGKNWVQVKR